MGSKTTSFSQFILWFGASVSIAEILTGALIAPLGFSKGMMAIFVGHIIGAIVLYLGGTIGAQSKLSSIESTRISFGKYGSYIFSVLNIVQLLGWTAVMIISGSKALNVVTIQLFDFSNETLWSITIGFLIALWIILGSNNISKVNVIAVTFLFIFTLILGFTVFTNDSQEVERISGNLHFGAAVELNVAMSLSWLPLIADYTRNVKNEIHGTFYSVLGYFLGSTLMFTIGLGAALYVGTSDISIILVSAGLGLIALFIVLFSTVTTTFLDVFSAGVSFRNISKMWSEKTASLVVCAIGVIVALFVPITNYESFLYLIGSVFAPLFAIVITDYFVLKTRNSNRHFNVKNLCIWVIGFFAYRLLMPFHSVVGITLPVMIGIGVISLIINGGIKICLKKSYKK